MLSFVAFMHHAGHGEVADSFFLLVTNGFEEPVPAGTKIEVEGAATQCAMTSRASA